MQKTCPRCGATFECMHSADCWCAAIILNEKMRRELAARYSDCLCKDCLLAVAQAADSDSTGRPSGRFG